MRTAQIDSNHTDARWVAELHLPTGKTRSIETEWKPSHWSNDNSAIVDAARKEVRLLEVRYGITGVEVRIYRETRRVIRQTIVESEQTLHSTIPAVTS